MPNTLAGLALFVSLLAPGFAYLARRESRFPARQYSTLRETAAVVTVSLICNGITLIAFGAFRSLWPSATPDVGRLAREGRAYIQVDYVSIGTWIAALLLVATSLAYVAACPPSWFQWAVRRVAQVAPLKPIAGGAVERWSEEHQRKPIRTNSGWTEAFQLYRESYVWVTCDLVDGRVIGGWLRSANPQTEETDERSIVLAGPVRIRGSEPADDFDTVYTGTIVIAANQLRFVAASYFDSTDEVPY